MKELGEQELNKNIMIRLKRIEGQVRGLQHMLEDEKCCSDVLTQIAAIRAAINKVGVLIFEGHFRNCLQGAWQAESDESLNDLVGVLNRFIR